MNVAAHVNGLLSALVGGRCYPNKFPQQATPTWPAIRFTVVGREIDQVLDGTDEGESDDIRVQVDFVAAGYEAARTLRDLGVAAMLASATPCVRVSEFETFDAETKTDRFVVDFQFHPSTSAGSPG